jgi:phosphoribosylformylglycinamidine synthase II
MTAQAPQAKDVLSATPTELLNLSRQRGLSLNAEEMIAIQNYFKLIGREPSEAELETIAQTWSEHCKHKTFRAAIEHVEKDEMGLERRRYYTDLLKNTIVRVTDELKRDFCLSVFKDNAGIVSFDGETALAFKAETHNHPSALEPYGGAGTGLGGVIRDVLGAGLGAHPIANTDVFCFAPFGDNQKNHASNDTLPPKRMFHGVVSGVRDYGNRMGIPTVNGAIFFDEDFHYNPLVFCGTLGIMSPSHVDKSVNSGDHVVVAGGRVGRDGIHGATFSSDSLTQGIPPSVVQIGNPIVQKKMMDVLLVARDRKLFRGLTDCGAGGLSSAIGELGAETGVKVQLEKVPLKYEGLAPWEIWLSESQERMVMAVPPENVAALTQLFASEDVECADIGIFTDTKRLEVCHGADTLIDIDMEFLHDGVPKRRMNSTWTPKPPTVFPDEPKNLKTILLGILSRPSVASKEWVIRQYDHEVQGRTVQKPLVGPLGHGPGDAAIMQIEPNSFKGAALSCALNPHMSRWDSYWMAASAIDEAVRNLICVGVAPNDIAILDNFCAGDPNDSQVLGEVVRAAQACYDFAKAYGTPFISGKDSFFNQFVDAKTGKKVAIPTTLLISALGWMSDVRKRVSMDLKKPGGWLYVLGVTKDELGGSQYGALLESPGGKPPQVNPQETLPLYDKLHEAMQKNLIASCHDASDGGLGIALAEMALAGGFGLYADLRNAPLSVDLLAEVRTDKVLFSESNGRFVVEVPAASKKSFETFFRGWPAACLGQVREEKSVKITDLKGKVLNWSLAEIDKSFRGGIKP